jgi:hypothetical protein
MNDERHGGVPPQLQSLLAYERDIAPVPSAVRARAMARARAAVTAALPAHTLPDRAWPGRLRWAVAAAILLMVSAVAGAKVYQLRARPDVHQAAPRTLRAALVEPPAPRPPVATGDDAPAPIVAARTPQDASRAELRLLRQARAAVARKDYAAALPPLAEHARRFKNGRLTEEREALRVRSLAGLGRTDEARRAAQGFEARYPRSVLLPAIKQMSN